VRAARPDLLHTHMVHADVYGSMAAHALRVPFVSTRHNDDRYLLGPFRYVDRAFMHGVRRIVAISDAVRAFHERAGLPRDKLVTIHYGLDEPPADPSEVAPDLPDDAPLVLEVGRLIEQKDHAMLLRAFARVHGAHPAARLAILGWGPLERRTRALADELGLAAAVQIPGRVEPAAWLRRADVFAHTPRWEGFGIVLLEAMLSSLPVVATRVSAIPEIVVDGETGILVAPGEADAAAGAISALLADAGRRRELGDAGRRRALEHFSVARMTDATLEVYREAVA
jgi:glycosyltransferase involved in cell wall biosynthesis